MIHTISTLIKEWQYKKTGLLVTLLWVLKYQVNLLKTLTVRDYPRS